VKRISLSLAAGCLVWTAASAFAQEDQSKTTTPPPKVLAVYREFLKPGKNGSTHERSESMFVQALRRAKWPTHYLSVDSLSGKTRSLFLTGYDSFEAWEKDVQATQANSALSAALDRATIADGDLLNETDSSAWAFNPDHSLNPDVDVAAMRYIDIEVFRVKPGHDADFDQITKLVIAAYQKIPDSHWSAYDNVYGASADTHAFLVLMKSAAEIDHNLATNKDFVAAMGEANMKKFAELAAVSIESSEDNLFVFNPRMSYVSDEWIKADPDFWKPKSAAAPAKKTTEEKPAQKPQ
jgi:hypothetical protein